MINYIEIKSIRVLDVYANTFTLQVDDPLHQFVADGVITHNSGGEGGAKRVAQ